MYDAYKGKEYQMLSDWEMHVRKKVRIYFVIQSKFSL